MSNWVNFKELREQLDFEAVLKHYNVEVRRKGDRHQGFCPLPGHDGSKRSPSFSADLDRGIWQCFGCGAKGNVLDFAAFMEGMNPADGAALRRVALTLQETFELETGRDPARGKATKPAERKVPEAEKRAAGKKTIANAPLDFVLKGLDPEHAYLSGRGFTAATVEHFGLGYCSRGVMKGRIAIPLHDQGGHLIGYAGRLADDSAVSEICPKYLFPGDRERDGVVHEFRKSLFVYGSHHIGGPVDPLIVVEGFPSVWWLWQAGIHHTVALMGASCSEAQRKLIVELLTPDGHVLVMSDGDDAGDRCAMDVFAKVAHQHCVRWIRLPERQQPTDQTGQALLALCNS